MAVPIHSAPLHELARGKQTCTIISDHTRPVPSKHIISFMLEDTWAARSSFLEGIEEQIRLLDECDVVVPVNKTAEYVAYVAAEGEKYDFEVKYFGHAGGGNLHIYTCSDAGHQERV